MMTKVFANLGAQEREKLDKLFEALEIELYERLQPENLAVMPPKRCMKPCALSIWPPPEILEELKELDEEEAA
jgi:hypothetical protein